MPRTLRTARHRAMCAFLIERRKAAPMTQAELARKIGRYQSYVADVERGQRRLDVVEFLEFADALGFDAGRAIRTLAQTR